MRVPVSYSVVGDADATRTSDHIWETEEGRLARIRAQRREPQPARELDLDGFAPLLRGGCRSLPPPRTRSRGTAEPAGVAPQPALAPPHVRERRSQRVTPRNRLATAPSELQGTGLSRAERAVLAQSTKATAAAAAVSSKLALKRQESRGRRELRPADAAAGGQEAQDDECRRQLWPADAAAGGQAGQAAGGGLAAGRMQADADGERPAGRELTCEAVPRPAEQDDECRRQLWPADAAAGGQARQAAGGGLAISGLQAAADGDPAGQEPAGQEKGAWPAKPPGNPARPEEEREEEERLRQEEEARVRQEVSELRKLLEAKQSQLAQLQRPQAAEGRRRRSVPALSSSPRPTVAKAKQTQLAQLQCLQAAEGRPSRSAPALSGSPRRTVAKAPQASGVPSRAAGGQVAGLAKSQWLGGGARRCASGFAVADCPLPRESEEAESVLIRPQASRCGARRARSPAAGVAAVDIIARLLDERGDALATASARCQGVPP